MRLLLTFLARIVERLEYTKKWQVCNARENNRHKTKFNILMYMLLKKTTNYIPIIMKYYTGIELSTTNKIYMIQHINGDPF